MGRLLKRVYSPVFLVAFGTFWPFLIPQFDFLDARTRSLSRRVGIDPWLYVYAFICVSAFWFLYKLFLVDGATASNDTLCEEPTHRATVRCRKAVVSAVTVLLVLGFGVIFYTVSHSYLDGLIQSAKTQQANPGLRYSSGSFTASAKVPGMIRMFAFSIVGCVIFMYAIALASPPWSKGWRLYPVLLALSIVAMLLRSLIQLDRNPPAVVAIMGPFVLVHRARFTPKALFVSVVGVTMLVVVAAMAIKIASSVRLSDTGQRNPILEYADLGIADASLAYRTTTHFSWGTATLMGPILFVPRGIGVEFEFPTWDSEWIWNPASNLLCTSIREFGIFGFVIYAIYGCVVGCIMRKRKIKPCSLFWGLAHLWALYILLLIWTQPVVASPDIWAAIILSLFAGGYVDRLSGGYRKTGPPILTAGTLSDG